MIQPIWLSEKIVKAIHIDQIRQHGGSEGIRDENLLSLDAFSFLEQISYINGFRRQKRKVRRV